MPTDRPNLFIVGAQKAGTSALAGWLGQHPKVRMAFPKEPCFLAFGAAGYPYPDGYGRPTPGSRTVVRDEASYLQLFAGSNAQVRGEASTCYFAIPGMAARLRRYNPEARIVIALRQPVERAYSAWRHARRDDLEPCANFADALAQEDARGEVEFLLRYRYMGLYAAALAEYQAAFPPAQLHVLFYEDLRAQPLACWQAVCRFLGIDPGFIPPFELRYNRGGAPRWPVLQRVLQSPRTKRAALAVLPHRTALAIKNRMDDVNLRALAPMSEQLREQLQDYYRADIAQVAQLTGRDLEHWLR